MDGIMIDTLYEYILENYTLDGTAQRLVYDAIRFVANHNFIDLPTSASDIAYLIDSIGIETEEILEILTSA